MEAIKCRKCSRLLFKGEMGSARIEIKCPKCGYVQKIEGASYTMLEESGHESRRSANTQAP